jgi:hypothetical protein
VLGGVASIQSAGWFSSAKPNEARLAELARQLGSKNESERAAAVVALSAAGRGAIPYLRQAALDPNPDSYRAAFDSFARMDEEGFVAVLELFNERDWTAKLLHSEDSAARFVYSRARLDPTELPRLTAAIGALHAASSNGRLTSRYQPLVEGVLWFAVYVTQGLETTELDNQIFSIAEDADNQRPTYLERVRWRWHLPPRRSEVKYSETRVEEPSTVRRSVYAITGLWGNVEDSTAVALARPFGNSLLLLLTGELKSLQETRDKSDGKDLLATELHTMQRVGRIANFILILKGATRQSDTSWSDRAAETLIENMYFIPDDRFVSKGREAKMFLSEKFVYSLHEGSWESNLSLTRNSRAIWTDYVRQLHDTLLALHSEKVVALLLSTIAESADTDATVFACYHLSEWGTVRSEKLWENDKLHAALARNLEHGDPEMRYASVRALALSPRSDAGTLLKSTLSEEDDPVVRSAILEGLSQ